jgi:hypothetical protein
MEHLDKIIEMLLDDTLVTERGRDLLGGEILLYGSKRYLQGVEETVKTLEDKFIKK